MVGKLESKSALETLNDFRKQAHFGNVPSGYPSGHKDGWGIVAYQKKSAVFFQKEISDAFNDGRYLEAAKGVLKNNPHILVAHLRKASVGKKKKNNSHPFIHKNFSFCQNGTIFESQNIPLKKQMLKMIQGDTDSERFFLFFLQLLPSSKRKIIARDVRSALLKAILQTREKTDYTAINCLISDGSCAWALREVNEKNKIVKEKKLENYYTLFWGISKKNNFQIISSEKINIPGINWKLIENHSLIEFKLNKKGVSAYSIRGNKFFRYMK